MDKVKNKNNFSRFFIVFLTSFLLGVIFSFYISKNVDNELLKNNYSWNILVNSTTKDLDLTKFWEVYNLIKINNYNAEWYSKEKLVDSAIKGMVEWLWDKHSEYFDLEETKKFNEVLSWDFEWIWAVIEKNVLWVKIERIIKWSPAKKYWLKSGDVIIKANWTVLEWLSVYDSVEKIKWPAWTKVVLDIIRPGEKNILEIEVIRDKIKIPSVDSEILNWDIAYISINMFWEDTASEFKKALEEVSDSRWLIIDLRDNWGWYLQSAVEILSNLVEDWKVLVTTKYKNIFSDVSYSSTNDGNIYEWKIVILINENSASASEITAWALKDYNKAILVWEKSYWKGSVQKPFDLKDNSMLKLTIAKWFTPNDVNIDHEWIIPDIEVSFEKQDYDYEECINIWACNSDLKEEDFDFYDRQLEVAKEVLNTFIKDDAYKLSIDDFLEKNEKYKPNLDN